MDRTVTKDELTPLAMAAKHDQESFEQLQIESQSLVRPIAVKHAKKFSGDQDDIVQEFNVIFRDYVRRYDSAKGQSWRTFITSRMRYFCQDYSRSPQGQPICDFTNRRGNKLISCTSMNDFATNGKGELIGERSQIVVSHYRDDREERRSFQDRIQSLNETERIIMNLYYIEGETMNAIAESIGLSESRVSQIHKRVLNDLRSITTL
jgi:RNA polymerase sigma factor (sigma-70 family)